MDNSCHTGGFFSALVSGDKDIKSKMQIIQSKLQLMHIQIMHSYYL